MNSDFLPPERVAKPRQAAAQTPKLTSSSFQTPEEVAAADDLQQPAQLVDQLPAAEPQPATSSPSWRDRLDLHWPPGKKEWLLAAAAVILVGGVSALLLTHHSSKPVAIAKPAVKVAPQKVVPATVPSTLTGLPVVASVNQGPVTAVMVENSTDARPQSGLSQAGVIFEAIAEGGVTRFMALYQDTAPNNVGPIRSARPYYIQWALGFDAGYAHVGGSPDGLADIKTWGVKDLDEFANGGSYHRVSSRAAPHNVYTGIPTLNQLEARKGYTTSTYSGFVRKAEAPSKHPTATNIKLTLSGSVYNAQYTYNPVTNSYNRSEGGAALTDANTSAQLSPKVVVAMVVPESRGALDASGAYYSNYNVIGSGAVYVFQDGTVSTGQWTKTANTSQITFADSSGQPIKLNPGQTWLTAVLVSGDVSYTP